MNGGGDILLYLVAFLSGASLMSLEMVGSRILAPYFGSSILVWGSLIGTVLAALTAGYYLGGYLSDRWPSLEALGWVLLGASFFTSVIPPLSRGLLPALANYGASARWPSLAACGTLFFAPAFLMGMVSPWAVRLCVSSVERAGRAAGLMYAVSNAGSIAGTFFTSFFWISWQGTNCIIVGLSLILLTLACITIVPPLVRAPSRRSFLAIAVLTAVLQVSLLGNLVPSSGGDVVYEARSLYHHIYVVDTRDSRLLKFDKSIQGGMKKDDPFESAFPYADYFHLALIFNSHPRNMLAVGLGAGLAPKRFWRDYPGLRVQVAELDPEVVKVCYRYFDLPKDERLQVEVKDGRMFLRDTPSKYDVILLDAYFADAVPFHLTTREFYEIVRDKLNPGGVVAYNMIGALEGPRSKLFRSMLKTFKTVFPELYVFPVNWREGEEDTLRNIIVIGVAPGGSPASSEGSARIGGAKLRKEDILAQARALTGNVVKFRNFVEMASSLYEKDIFLDDVPILTDDYAPVDSLLHLY
ncbi:MAG: fused MFS/spermidine synthase [Firmicutes bacterium]|nr:fused MFS/spermidine synthase [Candidatus Fermentithermobacillaceae bacterium]